MWLLQMPALVSASDRELLSREVFGATRERMLREMGEALETLTATRRWCWSWRTSTGATIRRWT